MSIRKGFWKVIVCMVFMGGMALAQVTTGTVLGTVSDSTGAVIPGATVTLRNVDTGTSRTVTTDAAGRYQAPQLSLGSYEVVAESPGFQTAARTGITLTVGREAVVDFTLQVGAVAERITVTGEAPMIETTNATVSSLVDEKTMRNLPLNGRSFADLALIQPGVVDTGIGSTAPMFTGGRRFSINGARPQQSLYLLDGTDIVSPYENTTPNSVMGQFLGVDTVREFSLIQNNAGAQYGRAMGGIVNAVTRSGTNELHGNAFEFLRNDVLDANDFFLNRSAFPRPVLKRNQFGATTGGPIRKDKTFFFVAYEGLRQSQGTTINSTTLTKEARTGWVTRCATGVSTCTQPVPQTAADTVVVNPGIAPLLPIIPLPNTFGYQGDGLARYVGSQVNKGGENYGMVRIDHQFSSNDTMFGRFTIDNSDQVQPTIDNLSGNLPSGLNRSFTGAYRFSAVEYTHVFSPSVLNTVRVAFNRNKVTARDDFKASEFPSVTFIMPDPNDPTGYAHDGLPVAAFGGLALGVLNGGQDNVFADNTYSAGDTVNWTKGNHSLVLGGVVTRYQMNEVVDPWGWGNVTWANNRNALQGITLQDISPLTKPDRVRGWRQTYSAAFVQDDWKALAHLTLNLGLRWESVTGPKEVNGKMAGLRNILTDKDYVTYTDSLFLLHDALKGLSPRFGFAWTPLGEKTVFRGAFGLFKEIMLEYQYQLAIYQPPWDQKFNLVAPPWPDPIKRATTVTAGEPNIMERDMKYPYNLQWNFSIERQLTSAMTVKANYIGTRSISLVATTNDNQRIAVKTFDPTVGYERWLTPSTNTPKPNPYYASTRNWHNQGDAWYHALQLQVDQRYTRGFNYSASYTFSKNLDTIGTGNKCAETSGGAFYVYNLYDLAADKAPSTLNVTHNFTLSSSYELPLGSGKPFGSNWNGITNALAGNWQLNGTVRAATGQPFSIQNNFDRALNGTGFIVDRPDLGPGCSVASAKATNWTIDQYYNMSCFVLQPAGRYGNLPRNSVTAPGLINLDLSIFKGFKIGETRNLEFRAEFFNFLNHANFNSPGAKIFTNAAGSLSSSAGIISSAKTPRNIQLALKFTF